MYNPLRKKPDTGIMLGFVLSLVFFGIYFICYQVLTEPLYRFLSVGNAIVSSVLHIMIISIIGTALCCAFFLLRNKKLVVIGYGFVAFFTLIAALLGLIYFDSASRVATMQVILLFAVGPTIIGNAAAWVVYQKLLRKNS